MKQILTAALLTTTLTSGTYACDRSSFSALLLVYDKSCTKLPADYLGAYSKAAPVFAEMLTQAQDDYKSDPAFCQNNAKTVAASIAYYKKHKKIESC